MLISNAVMELCTGTGTGCSLHVPRFFAHARCGQVYVTDRTHRMDTYHLNVLQSVAILVAALTQMAAFVYVLYWRLVYAYRSFR
jgi:hypothetical protein